MPDKSDDGDYLTDRTSRPSFGSRPGPRAGRSPIDTDSLPPPPSRSKGVRHPLVVVGHGVLSLLLLAAVATGAGVYFGSRKLDAPGPLAVEKTVLIPRGSGTTDIAGALQDANVIDNTWFFALATRALKASDDLKAGEYLFSPGVSVHGVIDTLVEGKGIQHSLTVPEGLTSQAVVERMKQDDVLSGEASPSPREGSILPDTYKFERGTTRTQLLARMEAEQKAALDEIWKRRSPDLPLKSPAELVILASIVEKETGKADERTRVARVFLNRLQKGMRLQSDPTVIYGIAGGKGKLDRPIQRTDLDTPTPYNTYTIPGLPPGPIGNPGRAAMEAVANPSVTDDLYFVADGTGGHAFATTLEEHNRNVARLRKLEQDAAAAAAAQQAPTPAPAAAPSASRDIAGAPASPAPQTAAVATTPAAASPAPPFDPSLQPARNGRKPRTFAGATPTPGSSAKVLDPLQNKTYDLNFPQTVPSTE